MSKKSARTYSLIGLTLVIAGAAIWYVTRQAPESSDPVTAVDTATDFTTGSAEQLKLFLPQESLSILDQAPLAGLEDLSTTLVSTSIELDLN